MHAAVLYRFYDGMHACSGSLPLQHSMMACMRAAVFYRLNTIIWHACGFDRCQPFRSSFVAGGGAACLSGGLIRLVLNEMAGSEDHIVEGLFAAELVNHDLGLHSFWLQSAATRPTSPRSPCLGMRHLAARTGGSTASSSCVCATTRPTGSMGLRMVASSRRSGTSGSRTPATASSRRAASGAMCRHGDG